MKLLRDKIKRDTYMCSKLCSMVARGDLRDNHPQQRKSGQWDNNIRDNFIVTVIKNEDFDPIKICEQLTEEGVILWLIDGLQRSTTIENYKSGKFALGRNIDPCTIEYQEPIKDEDGNITYKNVEFNLKGKAYKDLPEKLKEDFDNCPINVVKHLDCTDEEVGRHIVRYNSGRPMVAAQKISAYMYNTAKYVKKLSGHAFFNDCANYSPNADKNGTVDKVVSEAIMGINFFDVWNKNAQKIGKHLNDNATDEMFFNFECYLDRLLDVVTPQTGELFSAKNALIWFMLFDKFSKTKLSDDKFQFFLENYDVWKKIKVQTLHEYELIKGTGEYTNIVSFVELDGCKSTKDRGVIEDKLLILETVMRDFLHINDAFAVEDNDSSNVEKVDCIQFVKDNVKDTTDEDMELYEIIANDVSDAVDENSWMLSDQNRPSYLAIVGYAIREDKDDLLGSWMTTYENKHTPDTDQKDNFLHMKTDFDSYIMQNVGA